MEFLLLLAAPLFVVAAFVSGVVLCRQPAQTRIRKAAFASGTAAVISVGLAIPSAVDNWQLHQPRPQGSFGRQSELWAWVVTVFGLLDYVAFIILFALTGSLLVLLARRWRPLIVTCLRSLTQPVGE